MLRGVKLLEGYCGKRKLLICFGVVIILAIAFLYYENFYNLNNRFYLQSKHLPSTSSTESSKDESSQLAKDKDILNKLASKLEIERDNTNYISPAKCWTKEKFTIAEHCKKCDPYYLKFLSACKETSFVEFVKCAEYGTVSRDCPIPDDVLIQHYWSFEFICLCFMGMFSHFVVTRKRFLDKLAMDRLRQQIND